MARLRRILGDLLLVLLLALSLWLALRGSLAQLDGERAWPAMSAPAERQRDARGYLTITAENRLDERMVVSPGHEARGILVIPGGQSGHPLSPFFRGDHAAWLAGEPPPFLPGETTHRLVLRP